MLSYKTPSPPLTNGNGRASLHPLSAASSSSSSSSNNNNRTNPNTSSVNKFKLLASHRQSIIGPDLHEIQATDEKQASVNQLSEWLASESAKKNKKKKKPPIHRHLASSHPLSMQTKPRIQKSEVEATDDKSASVKTLSSWMSGDPFLQKKVRTVRSGAKVIAKSRIFERNDDNEDAAAAAASRRRVGGGEGGDDVRAGGVEERQAWLRTKFGNNGRVGAEAAATHRPPRGEKVLRPYQQMKKAETPVKELKSVSDKKEWLSRAFKKEGNEEQTAPASGTVIAIDPSESFDKPGAGTPNIGQAKSFEVKGNRTNDGVRNIRKCASADDGIGPAVGMQHAKSHEQTKSHDNGRTKAPSPAPSAARRNGPVPAGSDGGRPSVARLYNTSDSNESEVSSKTPMKTLGTVNDKQAWLSSAFKKKQQQAADDNEDHAAKTRELARARDDFAKGVAECKRMNSNAAADGSGDYLAETNNGNMSTAKNNATGSNSTGKKPACIIKPAVIGRSVNKPMVGSGDNSNISHVESSRAEKQQSSTMQGSSNNVDPTKQRNSVADRAKWLKGAFN